MSPLKVLKFGRKLHGNQQGNQYSLSKTHFWVKTLPVHSWPKMKNIHQISRRNILSSVCKSNSTGGFIRWASACRIKSLSDICFSLITYLHRVPVSETPFPLGLKSPPETLRRCNPGGSDDPDIYRHRSRDTGILLTSAQCKQLIASSLVWAVV